MQYNDALLLLVTFSGPIVAVQAQKWIERARERKERQFKIFQTLMMTRAMRASSMEHVQALNLIDLFFDGKRGSDKLVREAWAVYFDHLSHPIPAVAPDEQQQGYNDKSVELLTRVLQTMSNALGYAFSEVQLKRSVYFPQSHADDNIARLLIRDSLVKILSGERSIPVSVVVSEDDVAVQKQLQKAILNTLSGEVPLKTVLQANSSD